MANLAHTVGDATVLLRDIAGDAATNAADKVRPDDEKLAQIDRPAEDNTWHETPDISKDKLKKQFQGAYKGNDPRSDAEDVASDAVSAGRADSGVNVSAGIDAAAKTAQDRTGVAPEDTEAAKEAARKHTAEYKAKTQEYLKKKMPQERRDQTIWRLKVRQIIPKIDQNITTRLTLVVENGD